MISFVAPEVALPRFNAVVLPEAQPVARLTVLVVAAAVALVE